MSPPRGTRKPSSVHLKAPLSSMRCTKKAYDSSKPDSIAAFATAAKAIWLETVVIPVHASHAAELIFQPPTVMYDHLSTTLPHCHNPTSRLHLYTKTDPHAILLSHKLQLTAAPFHPPDINICSPHCRPLYGVYSYQCHYQ